MELLDTAIIKFLADNNYASVEEWALDSDFHYDKHEDIWSNDEGYATDIYEYLGALIDELTTDEGTN